MSYDNHLFSTRPQATRQGNISLRTLSANLWTVNRKEGACCLCKKVIYIHTHTHRLTFDMLHKREALFVMEHNLYLAVYRYLESQYSGSTGRDQLH